MNQVAVITGGSRGIGQATAQFLAEQGTRIVTCGRDEEGLAETRSHLAATGTPFEILSCDIRSRSECLRLIETTMDMFGRVDLLVNNAGVAPLGPIEKITDDDFDHCLATNIQAVFSLSRAVWPIMKEQGAGTIVNISSFASVDPFPGFQVYGASKAWLNLFTKALADEGRPFGIKTFAVALGTVETRMLRGCFPDFPAEQTLAPRAVAELVAYLTNPVCVHASGNTIFYRK